MLKTIILITIFLEYLFAFVFDNDLISKAINSGLKPIPNSSELIFLLKSDKITKQQLDLGAKLYFDTRLSSSNTISCNTCHNLGIGGSTPRVLFNKINPPTIYNYVFNTKNIDSIDGLNSNFKNRIKQSLISEIEMNANENDLIKKINSMPDYVVAFKKVYGNNVKIDLELIADALLNFQKILFTPSRFDDFLNGNIKALSKVEQEGLNLFIDKGCVFCHNNVNLGGISKNASELGGFRFINLNNYNGNLVEIPTLRNILDSAPYMRNGENKNIKNVIANMMNDSFTQKEIDKIFSFFSTLSGKKIEIIYPILPMMEPIENK